MENWIDINEEKPDDITPVLVYGWCCDMCYQIKIAEVQEDNWWESGTGEDLTFKPTHWTPLPDPPKEIENP